MQNTVVLVTHNKGKIRELADPLARFGVQVVGLDAFPAVGDIEENGTTFEENALIKAREGARITGHICIADDSGLEVDALHGAPGIYSARYANDWANLDNESKDAKNIRKLLAELKDVPDAQRQCRFVCCMALVKPASLGGKELVVRGTWEGRILHQPQGTQGFGYDPVFWDEQIHKAAAELSREEKNARSHRGNALRLLLAQWQDFMKEKQS